MIQEISSSVNPVGCFQRQQLHNKWIQSGNNETLIKMGKIQYFKRKEKKMWWQQHSTWLFSFTIFHVYFVFIKKADTHTEDKIRKVIGLPKN